MPTDDRRGDHEDPRPDLGVFGRSVTVLIVVLLVAAAAVAVLVDPLGWVLAVVLAGMLLLWTRLVR
ncbi:hypothetical protein LQ327_00435 [Actinomycetospora endophytica]|uniref:DUF3040 family protein n=1 Tax=Actinomycetospora endophytica TaxID=2291215 RepID=A0ABS8P1J4_9PSEU|nr:hypothetical protein [Actinomycetospora endophytica]MCD2191857.1 hypothetical protein [Actinomycetospora endophytica]